MNADLLPFKPLKVLVSGQEMAASNWDYQPSSSILVVTRQVGDAKITWQFASKSNVVREA